MFRLAQPRGGDTLLQQHSDVPRLGLVCLLLILPVQRCPRTASVKIVLSRAEAIGFAGVISRRAHAAAACNEATDAESSATYLDAPLATPTLFAF